MKILHVSDVHIGAKVSFLGPRAGKYRQRLIETFESVYDKAVEEQVNLVAVCGDLFDSPFPSKTDVEIVKRVFKRLADAGIYIAVLPGNHDYLADGCVYLVDDLSQGNPRIMVFNNPEEHRVFIRDLDLGLYFKVNNSPKSVQSPLYLEASDPLPQEGEIFEPKYKVALAHGSVEINNQGSQNYPIKTEDIKNSGYDYVALGDWHSYLDVTSGDVPAVYPGCLEPLAVDQERAGNVVIVDITTERTSVRQESIGFFKIISININIENNNSILDSIHKEIDRAVKEGHISLEQVILSVEFSGQRDLESEVETEQILEYFENKVFYINLKDKTSFSLEQRELEKYPEYTVIGKYIKYLLSKKDVDKQLVDEAIQKGITMLENPS